MKGRQIYALYVLTCAAMFCTVSNDIGENLMSTTIAYYFPPCHRHTCVTSRHHVYVQFKQRSDNAYLLMSLNSVQYIATLEYYSTSNMPP